MYFPYLDTEKNNWISGTGLLVQANILSMNSSCYRLTARLRCNPQILLWNTKWFDQFGFFWTPTATHCNSLTATPIRLALDSVRPTGSQTQCRALLCGSFGPTLYLQCILTKPGATLLSSHMQNNDTCCKEQQQTESCDSDTYLHILSLIKLDLRLSVTEQSFPGN